MGTGVGPPLSIYRSLAGLNSERTQDTARDIVPQTRNILPVSRGPVLQQPVEHPGDDARQRLRRGGCTKRRAAEPTASLLDRLTGGTARHASIGHFAGKQSHAASFGTSGRYGDTNDPRA